MLLRLWRSFTAWRRGRPFWAGLFVIAGAMVILFPPFVGVKLGDMIISIKTIGGVSALLIGTLLIICGLSLWIAPGFRLASGIVTVLLSLVALVTTNLGGFLLGTVLSLLGGALAVAWTDVPKEPKAPGEKRRRKGRSELSLENPAPPMAAVALIALLAVQQPSADPADPSVPPPVSTTQAPTSSSVAPPSSSTPPGTPPGSSTPPPASSSVPAPPPSTVPPSTPATPPPAPAPVAGGREWTLTASRLDLVGLNFAGVVDSVLNGQVVKVLKFTATDMKIRDLVQTGEVSPGVQLVTRAAPGSTSTVSVPFGSPARIELFTVQLKGNLDILGIKIPVDYTAAHPPPLNVPIASFTEVTVRNADLAGGTLKIPGAKISLQSS
ncbi:DUF6114 domain-containing protein [Lentzea chajnantorensis]